MSRRPRPGPARLFGAVTAALPALVAVQRLSERWLASFGEIAMKLAAWSAEGKLRHREHIFDGLESAPTALNAMFTGENIGKILVRLTPDADAPA